MPLKKRSKAGVPKSLSAKSPTSRERAQKRKEKYFKPRRTRRSVSREPDIELMRPISHASTAMSLGQLQLMAKSLGIPFGGLTKAQLVRKINNYY